MLHKPSDARPNLTAVDLFAGAGGATQGLVDAGFVVRGAVELDEDACATYAMNHPGVNLQTGDILDMDEVVLRRKWRLKKGELTLLKACPPCQGFSTLGTGEVDDSRNDLILDIWRFIDALRPRAVLLENVPGIRSDKRLATLVRRARKAGYTVRAYDVDAAEFGVPQRRRRHIVCAIRNRKGDLPDNLMDMLCGEFDFTPRTAGEALRAADTHIGSPDPIHIARTLRPLTLKRVKSIPVGGSRFDIPTRMQLRCHRKLDAKATGRHATGPYGRVKSDQPAPTMTTRCTTPSCGSFIHPTEPRGLTLREAALLQTFPLNYGFVGGYDSIERQVGNAVPVRLAYALGLVIRRLITDKKRHD